ncbi:MAG: HAMP domain-containing histidine kinase [Desulfobulbaceae bacterium]|nr:HAMP domain-containing histidine kinase [Desulfobulbaceae bacterium]
MKQPIRLLHPILIFIFSILALGLSLFLYIYWYVEVSSRLQAVIRKFNLDPVQFFQLQTWVVIVVLSILVGIISLGIFIIFVYNLKIHKLYQLQQNFINNFTHELKTPVTSLKLYLETFHKYELPRDKQLKYIHYMLSDCDHLSANINRILNLARIESGSYRLEFVNLDLVNTIEEFVCKNDHMFNRCRITVDRPTNDLAAFFQPVDPSLFDILLMNLFTNGLKYNDAEQPELTISFERVNKSVLIHFKDNGCGIEPAEFKKIFKKFYQIKKEEASSTGSGLGLYLVDRIARLHKGEIVVNSEGKDRGTTFTLVLPTVKSLAEEVGAA